MSVIDLLIAYKQQVNTDISQRTEIDSIDPDMVGSIGTDLADILMQELGKINNINVTAGSAVPAGGADTDLYFQSGLDSITIWKNVGGTWAETGTIPVGLTTLVDGVLTGLRVSMSGFTATVTPGTWIKDNILFGKSGQTQFVLNGADQDNLRYDIIYADKNNNILLLAGTAVEAPVVPDLPPDTILVETITVPSVFSGKAPYSEYATVDISGKADLTYVDAADQILADILNNLLVNILPSKLNAQQVSDLIDEAKQSFDLQSVTDAGNVTTNDIVLLKGTQPYYKFSKLYSGGIYRYAGGIVEDASGVMYTASNAAITRIEPDGTLTDLFDLTTYGNLVGGIAFNQGYIYIPFPNGNKVMRYNIAANTLTNVTNPVPSPQDVAFDGLNRLYVLTADSVNRFDTIPSQASAIVAGSHGYGAGLNQFGANRIAVANDGTIYIADAVNDRIVKWNPGYTSGASGTIVASNIGAPFMIALDKAQQYLYIGSIYFQYTTSQPKSGLLKLKTDGTQREVIIASAIDGTNLSDIIFNADSTLKAGTTYEGGGVYYFNYENKVTISAVSKKLYANGKRILDTDDLVGGVKADKSYVDAADQVLAEDITYIEETLLPQKANDSNVVHKTGPENVAGAKNFTDLMAILNAVNDNNPVALGQYYSLINTARYWRLQKTIPEIRVQTTAGGKVKEFVRIVPANNYMICRVAVVNQNSTVKDYEFLTGYDAMNTGGWFRLTPINVYNDRNQDFELEVRQVPAMGPTNFGILFRYVNTTAGQSSDAVIKLEFALALPAVGANYNQFDILSTAEYANDGFAALYGRKLTLTSNGKNWIDTDGKQFLKTGDTTADINNLQAQIDALAIDPSVTPYTYTEYLNLSGEPENEPMTYALYLTL